VSGPFGGGKTTLLELLSRQRNPDCGSIFYGGVDLKYLPEDFVRSKIVQVPQDAFIFSRSVRKNILLDGSSRNDDLLYDLLSKLSFNRRLIDERGGLNAQLGERGVNLSGGQKQRLALSRALLLDRDVYLFDDIFSHVDIETEHYLIRGLRETLPKNSTVFLVSQRSQTLRICDWNLILNAGAVEFWGTPTQGALESHFLKDIEGLNHVARS
jgi:ATP-binding cassette subfamily B protein